jgi:uncharacterized membrane protein YphA (DoxX/SURF4 family)
MEAPVETAIQPDQDQHQLQFPHWNFASRVAFRFWFVYFGLYCLSTQILTALLPLPKVEIPDPSTFWPMRPIVLWTAIHIFRLSKPPAYADTGSGDKTFDWVLVFCLLLFAVLAAAIWSILDRKRQNYITLHKWFRLAIRLFLAGQMITYGLSKAVPLQMPFPYLTRLLTPYGNFSPMGVLWASIGSSPAYEIFAGCAELLGGILLIFPRTTALGALVCVADMIQVFMLNMTYDVPVKLLSFQLLLLALFLLAPDLKRLVSFFLLNRATEPSSQPLLFATRRANRFALAAQIVFGVWLLGMNGYGSWVSWFDYGGGRPKSPLYGIWEVDQQLIDGQVRSPLLTDSGRWRRAIFDIPNRMAFQRIDDSFAGYAASINVKDKTIALTSDTDKNWKADFSFQRVVPDQLTLDGDMDGHKTLLRLKLVDRNHFLLVNRGFHWISEFPFHR